MGFSNPNFPIMQCAIAFKPRQGNLFEKEGSILTVRPDRIIGVGTKSAKKYVWLRIQGLEENELRALQAPNVEGDINDPTLEIKQKYRYIIPLTSLLDRFPDFDIVKARDINIIYQPFMTLNEGNFIFTSFNLPFEVRGFVFDNQIGTYL